MAPELRRPLGLILSGGGSLGAWQAGCLAALIRGGLVFDKVLGFSAEALTGAAYFLGADRDLLGRWRDAGRSRILLLSPRLRPWFSLCSGAPTAANHH